MKIGIVCYPTVGGSGVLATELGHQLALRGHEVHFIAYDIPFRLQLHQKNIYFHEVKIHQYELFQYPDYALPLAVKIATVAKCYQLDILHVHYAIPHATSAFLAKQLLSCCKPAIITTLHGTDITLVGLDPAYFQIVKFSLEQSDHITAVSNFLRNATCDYFQICDDIEVIYNFFVPKLSLLGKKPIRHMFVTKEEKLLIHSSNYRSVKRPMDVMKIFLSVRQRVKCKLLLLGSGLGLEQLKNFSIDNSLENDVFFVGNDRDIDSYVASADLFLLPSSQESFGLAALEAMAYGVPVVAADVGGLPELIVHGSSGFLAPLGDVALMSQYAVDLLTDSNLYDFVAAESIKRSQQFCADKIVSQYEVCYKKALEKNVKFSKMS